MAEEQVKSTQDDHYDLWKKNCMFLQSNAYNIHYITFYRNKTWKI